MPASPFGLDGWRAVILIGAAGAVIVWFIRRALPDSALWLAQNGREAEAASEEGGAGLHVFEGFGGRRPDFVNLMPAERGGEEAGKDGLVLGLIVSWAAAGWECLNVKAIDVKTGL